MNYTKCTCKWCHEDYHMSDDIVKIACDCLAGSGVFDESSDAAHAMALWIIEHEQVEASLMRQLAELKSHEPPLLQCVECNNTESCAGAMARHWNHGKCKFCGGTFKVVRA